LDFEVVTFFLKALPFIAGFA